MQFRNVRLTQIARYSIGSGIDSEKCAVLEFGFEGMEQWMGGKRMNIVDIVQFNNGIAIVVDEIPKLTYEKHGTNLIGSDDSEVIFDCLYLQNDRLQKAFAGREFDLPMKDGTVTRCKGQYWSGRTRECANEIGIELGVATIQTLDALKKCYVFTGYQVNRLAYRSMVSEFFKKNPDYDIFGYWEYEARIKGMDFPRRQDHPSEDFQKAQRDYYSTN